MELTEEQQSTINVFKKYMAAYKNEKLVLYGTGLNAEAVVCNCKEYYIIGFMDQAKTGKNICGLKVMSEKEVVDSGCKYVVIVARPSVHLIIYKRIQNWSEENGIQVCDIYGNLIKEKIKKTVCKSEYFDVSYDSLWEQILKHDVISFDIFDTLLTRKTYLPQDVFELVEWQTEDGHAFFDVRNQPPKHLQANSDIYQIYNWIEKTYKLSQEQCQRLLHREIEKEKKVLTVRRRMKQCFQDCLEQGKKVYLVSDMYLPKMIMKDILDGFGINGYEDILVSCDYEKDKTNGLFKILKDKIKGLSCLHIGDDYARDYLAAKKYGIDAFQIMSPLKMLEISACRNLLVYTDKLECRTITGMFAENIFNDPFSLFHSEGRPEVMDPEQFGYCFVAPLTAAFILWLMSKAESSESVLFFSARDGYLFQKVYRLFKEKYHLKNMPEGKYLLISRTAMAHLEETKENAPERIAYMNYLEKEWAADVDISYFFDFMSRGTCQYYLQKFTGRPMEGLYVQRSKSGDLMKDRVPVKAFFKEQSALEKERRIFAMCDFLECIFTSPDASFVKFEDTGKPVFEKEVRSNRQLKTVERIHAGILQFCGQFADCFDTLPRDAVKAEYCDDILSLTESAFSRINLQELYDMDLDDRGILKNTGRDIFR